RLLGRQPLHHRADLLHGDGTAGADGRPRPAARRRRRADRERPRCVRQLSCSPLPLTRRGACECAQCNPVESSHPDPASSKGERSVFRRPPLSAHDIDRALASAARWLLGRQAPDGAWRSETYGVFKEGDALTPLAVNMLLDCDDEAVIGAAPPRADYLAAMAPAHGSNFPAP